MRCAAKEKNSGLVEWLAFKGSNINKECGNGKKPSILASLEGYCVVADCLESREEIGVSYNNAMRLY